jgi:hypothetical protein
MRAANVAETRSHRAFVPLSDPRINRKNKHLLIDNVLLSVPTVLSGAKSWDAIKLLVHA